jgi:uncharacterized RDD family membrane protein YckC
LSIFVPPATCDPLPPATEALPPDRNVGSLWRRVVAFSVDGLIVGLLGLAVTLPFFEAFSRLGSWGPLVGFCLALPYFVVLNSSIGSGQTLGKRLMHLQVVDINGTAISLGRSAVRYGVFAVPYFLNEMLLPATRTPWAVSAVQSIVIFTVGGATLYLVLFNRHTRQGIHDLAVRSYVADADKSGPLRIEAIWKTHWVILGTVLIVLFLGTGILGNKLTKWGPFPQLLEDVRLVEGMGGVQAAGVQDLNWSNWGSGEKKKILVINVHWAGRSANEPGFADQVAKLIIEHDAKVREHDLLRIVMIRGYYLGIAHAQVSHTYEHTPSEWNARLFGTSPVETPAPTKL